MFEERSCRNQSISEFSKTQEVRLDFFEKRKKWCHSPFVDGCN